jgi:hypothetical protein
MEQLMEQQDNKLRDYNREYMNKRYKSDVVKSRAYQQSIRLKKKLATTDEEWEKYKHHLADIVKMKQIMERIPRELVLELLGTI